MCFENFLRSLYFKQYVFFVQMQSYVWAALVDESCVWYWFLSRVLRYTVPFVKKQFFIFLKRGLRPFGLCTFFLKVSVEFFEKGRAMSPKSINYSLKKTLRAAQSLRFELCLAFFSSCEWKSCCEKFERLLFVN